MNDMELGNCTSFSYCCYERYGELNISYNYRETMKGDGSRQVAVVISSRGVYALRNCRASA